jgi:hypothetical protein
MRRGPNSCDDTELINCQQDLGIDPLLGLGHESELLSRPRFPLTASGQIIALSTARMKSKYSQRTALGCLENSVIKDEAREECWF